MIISSAWVFNVPKVMIKHQNFLTSISQLAKEFGISNTAGFEKALGALLPDLLDSKPVCSETGFSETSKVSRERETDYTISVIDIDEIAKTPEKLGDDVKLRLSQQSTKGGSPLRLYTQAFFWAYREKFSLGFVQTTGVSLPPSETKSTKARSTPSSFSCGSGNKKPFHRDDDFDIKPKEAIIPRPESMVPIFARKNNPLVKKIKSELNKLSVDNYNVIVPRVAEIITENIAAATGGESEDILPEIVEIIFEKVQVDILFLPLYAKMCVEFNAKYATFREKLLNHCKKEFEKPKPAVPELEGDPSSEENLAEMEEYGYDLLKWAKNRLANIKFISELRKSLIVTDTVINLILTDLLKHDLQQPIYENISHACEMITLSCGTISQSIVQAHFLRFDAFTQAGKLSQIEQVKIQNVVDFNKKCLLERSSLKTSNSSISAKSYSESKSNEIIRPRRSDTASVSLTKSANIPITRSNLSKSANIPSTSGVSVSPTKSFGSSGEFKSGVNYNSHLNTSGTFSDRARKQESPSPQRDHRSGDTRSSSSQRSDSFTTRKGRKY